jgi:hypothetical protein
LTVFALALRDRGPPAEAVIAAQEAVFSFESLIATDRNTHRPHLANALTILAETLLDASRPADAVSPARKAVALWRQGAGADSVRYES